MECNIIKLPLFQVQKARREREAHKEGLVSWARLVARVIGAQAGKRENKVTVSRYGYS